MELDNLIYIIITIAIFVISLLGQTKKKKIAEPASDDEVVYSLNDFEKILERKEEYRVSEKQNTIEDELDNTVELNNQNATKTDKTKTERPKYQKEENEINDGFDIKSAIIYSSILERKKFRR